MMGGAAESRLGRSVERDEAAESRQVRSRGDRLRAARTDMHREHQDGQVAVLASTAFTAARRLRDSTDLLQMV